MEGRCWAAHLDGLALAVGEDQREVVVEVRERPELAELREYLRGRRDTRICPQLWLCGASGTGAGRRMPSCHAHLYGRR